MEIFVNGEPLEGNIWLSFPLKSSQFGPEYRVQYA